jgi:ATP adenylyltransferase
MDYLWTPWRYRYVSDTGKDDSCIFCDAIVAENDPGALIVERGAKNFVILNRYPYTSGHLMIVPYAHVPDLASADAETLAEMMRIAQRAQKALGKTYRPEGFNVGVNLGRAAGAGITGHLHMHMLPRWAGDANFMTVTGETRVEPEELSTTYTRLRAALAEER